MEGRPQLRMLVSADAAMYDRYQGRSGRRGLVRSMGLAISPYFAPVLLIRLSGWLALRGRIGAVLGLVASRINYVVFGIEVARQTEIGPGLFLPHTRGTVVGAASIGRNAVIYHGVTFGARRIDMGFHAATRPVIGDDVIIGAGAKIIGAVTIGDRVRIGPNAVVDFDVEADCTVTAPAPVVSRRSDRQATQSAK